MVAPDISDREGVTAITCETILVAHERIRPLVHRTPVLTSASLNELARASLFFKCENLQKTGSFKIRGAGNAIFSLSEEEAKRGVVMHSSGNHVSAGRTDSYPYVTYDSGARYGLPPWMVPPHLHPFGKLRPVLPIGECQVIGPSHQT